MSRRLPGADCRVVQFPPATSNKTFGYHRLEILAALVNGVALIVISILIFSKLISGGRLLQWCAAAS